MEYFVLKESLIFFFFRAYCHLRFVGVKVPQPLGTRGWIPQVRGPDTPTFVFPPRSFACGAPGRPLHQSAAISVSRCYSALQTQEESGLWVGRARGRGRPGVSRTFRGLGEWTAEEPRFTVAPARGPSGPARRWCHGHLSGTRRPSTASACFVWLRRGTIPAAASQKALCIRNPHFRRRAGTSA